MCAVSRSCSSHASCRLSGNCIGRAASARTAAWRTGRSCGPKSYSQRWRACSPASTATGKWLGWLTHTYSNPRWPLTSSAAPPYPPSTSQALPSAIVSIAAAPMPIWVLKTYRKLEQNCRLLGSYYQVQYWKVEITGYFNTTYTLEIRDALGTTVGKSFAGSVVSIWALMRSPDGRIGHRRAGLLCGRARRARGRAAPPARIRWVRIDTAHTR